MSFPALRVLCRAAARWLERQGRGPRVLIGWDNRFASERMAREAADVLSEAGLRPLLSRSALPTPVLTHAATRRRVAGALMCTASHNPPAYHGVKLFDAGGCALSDRDARWIEARCRNICDASRPNDSWTRRPGRRLDLSASYRRDLLALLDRRLLAASRKRILYDAMHGCGAGILDSVLAASGLAVEVLRATPDPLFGGETPDPVPERLRDLARRVRAGAGTCIGLATDGDADRFGAVDEKGRILNETRVLALLIDHLARSGRIRRGVALAPGTGSLVEKVAAHHGLRVQHVATGFKHLARALARGEVDAAGEASGGFAWARMGRDKDGMLAGCLLCEIAAADERGLCGRLDALERRFGRALCARRALHADETRLRAYARLGANPPDSIGGSAVRALSMRDGLRFELDDGFAMLRRSGTEPVVRLYAEAVGARRLAERLEALASLLD